MKSIRTKIIFTSIVIIYLTIRYISTPYYCVDFPCIYELKNGIIHSNCLQLDSIKDLLVFISDYPEHASGGSCFDKSVHKEEQINYLGHQIKLTNEGLFIDNKIVKTGDSIITNNIEIKPINLWWIYHNEFKLKYYGKIYGLRNNETLIKLEYPRYFVAGYNSTKESFNYLTALLYLSLIVYWVMLIFKLRNFNAVTANTIFLKKNE